MRVAIFRCAILSSLVSLVVAFNPFSPRDIDNDVCGEINEVLYVPSYGKSVASGTINACICLSTIPTFIATNSAAISGTALAGKDYVTAEITAMLYRCGNIKQCTYPPRSVPQCQSKNPCGFTCKDGYTPSPSNYPTQCVCKSPHKVCNGICGNYSACPTGSYSKRNVPNAKRRSCPTGLKACGILGRSAKSWECIDTQSDLESCGGCAVPLLHGLSTPDGEDCAAIAGVSDVSCVNGQCSIHRCMPGYKLDALSKSCVYSEDEDPALLAAQYGLDYVSL
ncbi:uncharacterized protein LACBIDRAFT_307294 [Laccaria bicolor S238N-H82]|uniref:Predicted protein n=1 Tax=Laccaria bicolor (strain S238N-H82 / ATCC MYA-4686) TaxID=486041 RepID=B0DPU5_LACBS|nr:uncharacterized protein LACBIDRAFT_307294 [Laccaria bicolor S238N-H82]EDR03516.1 predicted protein [Laccaria bicolor S238N-H82]|eukprot:XP_001885972.1 predicted protein [Laccaria bicolor S238N-H82]